MIVQHNMAAANTNRQLGINSKALSKSTEKLSSGYRINRAGDDAAGLSISEKMRGQIRGLNQASRNAQDGISLIQTAEGALNETHSILQRMRELAVQASSDTNVSVDRAAVKGEIDQLKAEITRIANETEFNTKKLIQGSQSSAGMKFQVGANSGQFISLKINDMRMSAFTSHDNIIVSNADAATHSITIINNALERVSQERSKLGAVQNRLEHTIDNADNTAENLQAAESRVRDVDMAKEMVQYSKNNILQQASQSMLAQANQSTQSVLSLLQ